MKTWVTMGALAGAAALALAGCSSSGGGAQEDVAYPGAENDAQVEAAPRASDAPNLGDTPHQFTLSCTNKVVTLTLPAGITAIQVDAIGASGYTDGAGSNAGRGGAVTATLNKQNNWGTTLYAKVGCQGGASGGWPNGGNGSGNWYGGGGSTSIETQKSAFTPIIVAGGGGSVGHNGDASGGSVGIAAAGTVPGNNYDGSAGGYSSYSSCAGQGGTQTGGGSGGSQPSGYQGGNGTFGKGGDMVTNGAYPDGGAGGGGYYGGGAGCSGSIWHDDTYGGGGAGSSWVIDSPANAASGVTYTLPNPPQNDGSLGITYMCGASECQNPPAPSPSS